MLKLINEKRNKYFCGMIANLTKTDKGNYLHNHILEREASQFHAPNFSAGIKQLRRPGL